jgi:hypothetical protein
LVSASFQYSQLCDNIVQKVIAMLEMIIWHYPSSTTLFRNQSWWCASFHIRSNATVCPHRSIAMFQKISFKCIFAFPIVDGVH